jgi:hypothetical protein
VEAAAACAAVDENVIDSSSSHLPCKMGAGSSVSLKKAINNDDVAGQLFDEIDGNHDGQLTIVEVRAKSRARKKPCAQKAMPAQDHKAGCVSTTHAIARSNDPFRTAL